MKSEQLALKQIGNSYLDTTPTLYDKLKIKNQKHFLKTINKYKQCKN